MTSRSCARLPLWPASYSGHLNTSTGEASRSVAANLVEHTADLGGTTVLGGISAFGVDAAGELYVVNHSAGTILKIVGAATAPAAPTHVRIIR